MGVFIYMIMHSNFNIKSLKASLNWNDLFFSGVLASYKGCISRVQLYGPTNFAPTINHVAAIARQFTDGSQYFILLIITDGIITDMPQTKKVRFQNDILTFMVWFQELWFSSNWGKSLVESFTFLHFFVTFYLFTRK